MGVNRTNTEQFQLRLPPGLRDRIRTYAESYGRSTNAEIVRILEREFPEPSPIETRVNELLGMLKILNAGASNEAIDRLLHEIEETIKGMVTGRVTGIDEDQRALIRGRLNMFNTERLEHAAEDDASNYDPNEIDSLKLFDTTEKVVNPFPPRR